MLEEKTRETTYRERECLIWLNDLRESGITNMFQARPLLIEFFDLELEESKRIMKLWRINFDSSGNYESVKIEKELIR